jgi:hypothetical protein
VEIGRRSTAVALERLPARILTEINKRVGFQLVVKAGEKGVLNLAKWVPLVGGPIGAAVDGFSCKPIATSRCGPSSRSARAPCRPRRSDSRSG